MCILQVKKAVLADLSFLAIKGERMYSNVHTEHEINQGTSEGHPKHKL